MRAAEDEGAPPAADPGATCRRTSADPTHLQARHARALRNVRKSGRNQTLRKPRGGIGRCPVPGAAPADERVPVSRGERGPGPHATPFARVLARAPRHGSLVARRLSSHADHGAESCITRVRRDPPAPRRRENHGTRLECTVVPGGMCARTRSSLRSSREPVIFNRSFSGLIHPNLNAVEPSLKTVPRTETTGKSCSSLATLQVEANALQGRIRENALQEIPANVKHWEAESGRNDARERARVLEELRTRLERARAD